MKIGYGLAEKTRVMLNVSTVAGKFCHVFGGTVLWGTAQKLRGWRANLGEGRFMQLDAGLDSSHGW